MCSRSPSHPFEGITRRQVQSWITDEIHSLENSALRGYRWAGPLVPFLRELQNLAAEDRLDVAGIRDWKERFQNHVTKNRLKGMEPTVFSAEALEYLAEHESLG